MQPPSLDPSLKIYHRVGTRNDLTETRREKQTSVSELSTLGFGQEVGALHQADVGNLRKEDLPPHHHALDPLRGFLWGLVHTQGWSHGSEL